MQMTNISIKGCAAFADLTEFPLSSIVAVQGKNRQGKSALLACIKYPFQSGHDPDMVNGEEGEIVITFDDGSVVRAVVDKNKTERMVKTPGATRWAKSRKFIDEITNAISFDPIGFLKLKEREQVETLLRIMPVQVTTDELTAAVKGFERETAEACANAPDANGLETINLIRSRIYSDRTRVNVEADTYEKHAAALAQGLKDLTLIEGADWDKEAKRLQGEASGLAAEEEREQGQVREEFIAAKADLERGLAEALGALKLKAGKKRDAIAAKYAQAKTSTAAELAVAQVRVEQKQKSAGQQEAMEAAKKEAATRRARSGDMTAAISRLDEVKRTVASRMDIKGIDISDGRICREEKGNLVPLAKWNLADQIVFVLRIAVLSHGKAGFICLDDAEHLDSEKRKLLTKTAQKYAAESGLQFIIATVGDGPLSVTDGAAA